MAPKNKKKAAKQAAAVEATKAEGDKEAIAGKTNTSITNSMKETGTSVGDKNPGVGDENPGLDVPKKMNKQIKSMIKEAKRLPDVKKDRCAYIIKKLNPIRQKILAYHQEKVLLEKKIELYEDEKIKLAENEKQVNAKKTVLEGLYAKLEPSYNAATANHTKVSSEQDARRQALQDRISEAIAKVKARSDERALKKQALQTEVTALQIRFKELVAKYEADQKEKEEFKAERKAKRRAEKAERLKLEKAQKEKGELDAGAVDVVELDDADVVKAEANVVKAEDKELDALEADKELYAVEADKELYAVEADKELDAVEADKELDAVEADKELHAVEADKELHAVEADKELDVVESDKKPTVVDAETTADVEDGESTTIVEEGESAQQKESSTEIPKVDKKCAETLNANEQNTETTKTGGLSSKPRPKLKRKSITSEEESVQEEENKKAEISDEEKVEAPKDAAMTIDKPEDTKSPKEKLQERIKRRKQQDQAVDAKGNTRAFYRAKLKKHLEGDGTSTDEDDDGENDGKKKRISVNIRDGTFEEDNILSEGEKAPKDGENLQEETRTPKEEGEPEKEEDAKVKTAQEENQKPQDQEEGKTQEESEQPQEEHNETPAGENTEQQEDQDHKGDEQQKDQDHKGDDRQEEQDHKGDDKPQKKEDDSDSDPGNEPISGADRAAAERLAQLDNEFLEVSQAYKEVKTKTFREEQHKLDRMRLQEGLNKQLKDTLEKAKAYRATQDKSNRMVTTYKKEIASLQRDIVQMEYQNDKKIKRDLPVESLKDVEDLLIEVHILEKNKDIVEKRKLAKEQTKRGKKSFGSDNSSAIEVMPITDSDLLSLDKMSQDQINEIRKELGLFVV